VVAILKMATARNFSMSGINSGHHNLPTYQMSLKSENVEVVAATTRNFSMSGINSGHHNLPTYEMPLKLDNVEFVRYCGGHFENGDH
jgi:5-carboxymethyl-2-hydroxymuconate isomerase